MGKRAQISLEYLMVMGFAMLIIIPVILVFFLQTEDIHDNVNLNQARRISRKIVNAAHSVYYVGEPSQTLIEVVMPEKINSINISGRELIFEIETQGGLTDIYEIADMNLTGSLSTDSGRRTVKVEALSNSVRITDVI